VVVPVRGRTSSRPVARHRAPQVMTLSALSAAWPPGRRRPRLWGGAATSARCGRRDLTPDPARAGHLDAGSL